MKTHFANVDRANESDPNDYWSPTVCGIDETESPLSDRWEYVTCKKCLRNKEKYQKSIGEAMEHSCNEMKGFVEFINEEKNKTI